MNSSSPATIDDPNPANVVVHGDASSFRQEIITGKHRLDADEPVSAGGDDAGPSPYDYLLAALGVCTSMTVGFYARRKQMPLENITVSLWHSRIHRSEERRVGEECRSR